MSKNKRAIIFCSDIWKQGYIPTYMENKFKKAGFETHHLVYPMYKKEITADKIVENSMDWAQEIKDSYDHVTFIGHGFGGRIGLAMLAENPIIFDAVVTVATPYGPSPLIDSLADLGPIQDILAAVSPLTLELRKNAKLPTQLLIPSLSIAAHYDSSIANQSTSKIIDEHTVIYHSTHSSVITKQRTFMEILGWLNYAVFCPESFS
jgi:hypothetical protein